MPLVSPFMRMTCPFCFKRFHLADAPHRKVGLGAPQEADAALGAFFEIPPPPMGKVIDPPKLPWYARLWQRFAVPAEAADERKICPGCHVYVPDKIASGEVGSEVIAIVGARSSGKSNYFGVLLNLLR